jgi:hypothetical protein
VERFVAQDPVDQAPHVPQLVALAEGERHHESGVEPHAFHHNVGRDEVPDEVALAFKRGDIELVFGHALHVLVDEILLRFHRGHLLVQGENFFAVEREGLQDVFERDAVVGLFPHLLGEVEVAFGRFEVGIDAERDGAVDHKLCRIEERNEKFNGVALVFGHLGPVVEVFLERYFMREPRIADRLVVELDGPRILRWVKVVIFGTSFAYQHIRSLFLLSGNFFTEYFSGSLSGATAPALGLGPVGPAKTPQSTRLKVSSG